MKKIKKVIAALLVAALMIEPCIAAGNMSEVKASDVTNIYEQMKVNSISIHGEDETIDKNALEITDDVTMYVDVSVNVPEGWAVTSVDVNWCAVNDYYYDDTVSEIYDVTAQPENHVFTLERKLHKYMGADTYYVSGIGVEYVNESDENMICWLSGYAEDESKVASEDNPVKFTWDIYDWKTDDEYTYNGDYTGSADYTILSAAGEDKEIPLITNLEMDVEGALNKSTPTEVNVTFEENGSGISFIYFSAETDGYDMDELYFEAEKCEQYTGTQTVTLTSDEEMLAYRSSGKYTGYYLYVEDFAGNSMEYYVEDDPEYLVGYDIIDNEDGTSDEVLYKIPNISYTICDGHRFVESVTKATTSKNGSVSKKCKYCGAVKENSKTTIYRIDKVKLSTTSYTYNGKVKKPTVSVYDSKGNKISASDYTVNYPDGRKNVGEYKVKIVFKGNYKGTVYRTFKIKPEGTSITGRSGGDNRFTVKWKKQPTQTSGYQVRYSTSSDFESYKTKTISGKDSTSTTVKKLKSNKKYYIKVRTYKTVKVNGESKKIYSSWSNWKSVTTK